MKNTIPIPGPKVNTHHSKAGSGLVVGLIPNYGLVRSKFELVLVCYIGFEVVCMYQCWPDIDFF